MVRDLNRCNLFSVSYSEFLVLKGNKYPVAIEARGVFHENNFYTCNRTIDNISKYFNRNIYILSSRHIPLIIKSVMETWYKQNVYVLFEDKNDFITWKLKNG